MKEFQRTSLPSQDSGTFDNHVEACSGSHNFNDFFKHQFKPMKRSYFDSVIGSSQISSTSSSSIEVEVYPSSPTLSWERSRVLDCYEFQAFLSAEVVHNRALSAPSAAATSVPVFSAMFGSRMFDLQVLRLIVKALIQPSLAKLDDNETRNQENNPQQQEQRSPIL
jgi:hypothetical protein